MLRLIHQQSGLGAILIDDIDDGLPNKTAHRLGSSADPHVMPRDGYANEPKQPCYIPYSKPTDTSLPGYVDLDETPRVALSAAKGKIAGFVRAGLISVTTFAAADLATPVITGATLDDPAAGDVTIDGTGFLSLAPNITSVRLQGAGVGDVTLTQAQIEGTAPGAVSDIEIIIDSTLITSLASGDTITVTADDQTSNTFTLT